MGHHCCSKQKVKRGLWSPEEDEKLVNYITNHGHGSWSSVPKQAGLQRCGKSCRLRWINYLRPDLKRGSFTEEEERTIIEVHRILGNRWAQIAKHLPGRTDNEVKNFWNSCIKKKLLAQGLDPNTHNLLPSNQKNSKKNNPPNSAKSTTPYHRMPSNSTSLVFSIDNPSPENIIREAIQSCFPSSNNGIQSNIYPNHNEIQDLSSQNIALSDSSKVSNLVMTNVNNCAYMVDESYSMWNDAILENLEQPLARAEVVMQPQQVGLCDDGVDHDYGIIKNLQVNQNLDDTSTFNSPCFDLGFGDYSSIIMSGSLYGEMGLAMDQVAWGNC